MGVLPTPFQQNWRLETIHFGDPPFMDISMYRYIIYIHTYTYTHTHIYIYIYRYLLYTIIYIYICKNVSTIPELTWFLWVNFPLCSSLHGAPQGGSSLQPEAWHRRGRAQSPVARNAPAMEGSIAGKSLGKEWKIWDHMGTYGKLFCYKKIQDFIEV